MDKELSEALTEMTHSWVIKAIELIEDLRKMQKTFPETQALHAVLDISFADKELVQYAMTNHIHAKAVAEKLNELASH